MRCNGHSMLRGSITHCLARSAALRALLAIVLLSVGLLTATSALAAIQTSTQRGFAGGEAGGWSGNDKTLGPPNNTCANMGAVGKVNVVFNFGFTLPDDNTKVTGIEAFIKGGATTDQDVQLQLTTDATHVDVEDNLDPILAGMSQVIVAFGSGGVIAHQP